MSNPNQPLVTVITPVYNLGDFIAETIESVLAQDYPNIQYLVLNDGSKDHTEDVLRHYTGRLHWETHENMGESATVNKGFGLAKGEYVVVVNADDPIRPGMISKLVDYMQHHPDVLAVYPDWLNINEKSEEVGYIQAWEADYKRMVSYAGCVPGPGAMIRRSGLTLVKGRNVKYRYTSDMDFWFRLGLHGPLARFPEALATHRGHSQSQGVYKRKEVGLEIITMIEDFFALPDLPAEIQAMYKAALSSAYFEAGIRMPTYPEMRQYFLKSFRLHTKGWLNFRLRPPWVWSVLFTPEIVSKAVYVVFNPRKYIAYKTGKSKTMN